MLEDLEALNERIYELYGRLYENGELLTKKQSDYIADRLFEQYKKEYEILKLNTEPDRAIAQYRAEERGELLTPRSPCWFKRLFGQRKNKAAELIEREEQKIAEEGFAARESVLDSQADKPSEEQAAGGAENPSESAAGPTEQGADKPSEEQAAEGAENPSESAAGPTEQGGQTEEPNEEQTVEGGENPSETAEAQTQRSGQTQEQAEVVEQGSGSDIVLQEKSRAPRKPKADRELTAPRVKA